MLAEKLSFSISGEWITETVRNMFYNERKPYKNVEEILLGCMCGTSLSKEQLIYMAQDVLLGRAEFRGDTSDDTFEYVKTDGYDNTLFDLFDKQITKIENLEKENQEFCRKYLDLYDALENDSIEDCEFDDNKRVLVDFKRKYGEYTAKPKGIFKNSLLDNFLEAQRYDDNYGFLKPDGTFIPVDFANHLDWAKDHVEEMRWHEEFINWSRSRIGKGKGSWNSLEVDFVVEIKGYVLLHSPAQGLAKTEISETKNITKNQKEFLFNYYTDREEHQKAKEFLE